VIDQVMKNASCHDDKMEAYCKAVRPKRASSMAYSSTTCHTGTTRRRTSSPKSCWDELLFPRTFLRGTSPSRPSTSSRAP
jgi:hypothetical protein